MEIQILFNMSEQENLKEKIQECSRIQTCSPDGEHIEFNEHKKTISENIPQEKPPSNNRKTPIKIKNIIPLTENQQLIILKRWNDTSLPSPSLIELTKVCFYPESVSIHSKEYMALKEFLIIKGITPLLEEKPIKKIKKDDKIPISENSTSKDPPPKNFASEISVPETPTLKNIISETIISETFTPDSLALVVEPSTSQVHIQIEVPKNENIYTLTDTQKLAVLQRWNNEDLQPPSLKELMDICFFPEHVDSRSKKGRILKEFLITRRIRARPANEYAGKIEILLSDEQKEFITNNCSNMSFLEMTRILFKNPLLTVLHQESRVVNDFVKTFDKKLLFNTKEDITIGDYKPPRNILRAMNRVNKYILECISAKDYEKNTKIVNNLKSLVRFCHLNRFILLMNNFTTPLEKELFEGSYIRYVWDKPDLMEEELDSYLNLCCDIVNYTRMQKELDVLNIMIDDNLKDSEGKKLAMSLVEMKTAIHKEMDDNHKRQTKAIENLQGKRNERIDNRSRESASILQLVEVWREEKERKRLLKLVEEKRKIIKKEIERLETLENIHAEIFGLNKESFL